MADVKKDIVKANFKTNKKLLKMWLEELDGIILYQIERGRGNKDEIIELLDKMDEKIMIEIGDMIDNTTDTKDKKKIQEWITKVRSRTQKILETARNAKGNDKSITEALNASIKEFKGNKSSTVLKEMKKVEEDNKEENAGKNGVYKRKSVDERYDENEKAIKKAEDMKKKAKEVEKIKGNNTPHRLQKNFTDTANREFENWKKRINNIEELSKDNFTKEDVEDILNDLSYDIKDAIAKSTKGIPEGVKSDFEKLRVNLEKIDLDDAYNTDLTKETKDAIRDILVYDEDKLKTKTLADLERVMDKISEEAIRKNLIEKALEISDPEKAREGADEQFINGIDQYWNIFPEEKDAIEKWVRGEVPGISGDDRNKKIEEKFAQMAKDIFDAARTDEHTEDLKIEKAKIRKWKLDQEKAQVEKHKAAEKEHNDFKDLEEMTKEELNEIKTDVTNLETETNELEGEKDTLEAEGNRLEAEVNTLESQKKALQDQMIGLEMELDEDDEKRNQSRTATASVDPTKLDLEDLGFSKEFQLEKESLSGFNPTTVYHNFVTEDVSQRSGRNQDGDNLIDAIYNQLKKESGFANVAEKLDTNGALLPIKREKGLVRLGKYIGDWFNKRTKRPTRQDKQIEESLKAEIKKRIDALRDAHTAAQSAPVAGVLSAEDRLEKERAYNVASTEYETKRAEYEAKYEELINKANEYRTKNQAFMDKSNEYETKKADLTEKEGMHKDIKDKLEARKKAFEDSLKVKKVSDNKYQSNLNKAIYKTVNDGKRVNAESVRNEAEGEEIDI